MTNFEKHRNEIKRIVATSGGLPAKVNGELRPCRGTICNDCEFDKGGMGCTSSFIQWAVEDDGEDIIKSCEFCKYDDKSEDEYPCIECKERYLNQFEPKPKEPELKPCPFCGGKAKVHDVVGGFIIHCDGCCTETRVYGESEETIKAWNKRCGTWISRIKEEV